MYHILLIDDDPDIQMTNKTYLEKKGFHVQCIEHGKECLHILQHCPIDCIVLDILLENEDGYVLCQKIKKMTNTPIIFLTNLIDQQDIEQGFIVGGDDYMVKPYDLRELELRIIARIHQHTQCANQHNLIQEPPLVINLDSRVLFFNNNPIQLTSFEFDILVLLVQNPERVFTIAQIYQLIWRMPDIENAQTVQVHIAHLRKKIDHACPQHQFIQTVWGKGYMFCHYQNVKDSHV